MDMDHRLEFYLPPEVKQVECHLTWMEELLPFLEKSVTERCKSLEEFITLLNSKFNEDEENDGEVAYVSDEHFEEMYNDENPKYCSVYASRLNEAAKLTYLSEFQEAEKELQLLDRIFDKLEECHRAAYRYAIDAMRWSIITMKNLKTPGKEVEQQDPVLFQIRWNNLQNDGKSKAVLKFLWGCLGGALKMNEECLLAVMKETLSLDPEYHVWYSVVYRSMRGIRRNLRRHQHGGLLMPPDEYEQLMCEEAHKRNSRIYLSIKDMAIMLKEKLWNADQAEWDKNVETCVRCQNFFEEALRIATERDQKKWKRKLQIYFGEFLLFGKGNMLDQDEGKRLYDVCLMENPDDTTVLHKVGKLCHYGASNKPPDKFKKYRNWDLAEMCYQRAIDTKPSNFPCVKDYLKLLRSRKNFEKYLEVCDQVIPTMKRDYQVADLKILQGCVLWIFNPFKSYDGRLEACKIWLYVISKLPDYAGNLYSTIKEPPFYWATNQKAFIKPQLLTRALQQIQGQPKNKNARELQSAINSFLENL